MDNSQCGDMLATGDGKQRPTMARDDTDHYIGDWQTQRRRGQRAIGQERSSASEEREHSLH